MIAILSKASWFSRSRRQCPLSHDAGASGVVCVLCVVHVAPKFELETSRDNRVCGPEEASTRGTKQTEKCNYRHFTERNLGKIWEVTMGMIFFQFTIFRTTWNLIYLFVYSLWYHSQSREVTSNGVLRCHILMIFFLEALVFL